MTIYRDKRGWFFTVMQGLGNPPVYKARYNKKTASKDACGWKGVRTLVYRHSKEEAEKDLAVYSNNIN